jgi:hypothetical protein
MQPQKTGVFSKVLAVAGTALVWFPILATVVLSVAGSVGDGVFRFDYLMPAELFPAAMAGGVLLLWAALRARSRRGTIGCGLGLMAGLLAGGQALAVATGLASGRTEPAGWLWVLILASIAGYALALLVTGVAGALLLRDLFRHGDNGEFEPDREIPG